MRIPSRNLVLGLGCRWAVSLGLALASTVPSAPAIERAANLIVFIGDGMGLEHVKAARAYKGTPLCFENFPSFATVDTDSLSGLTDSAAGATAIATGSRVEMSTYGVRTNGMLPSILEYCQSKGKRSGLVTTDHMTAATPAAFATHATNRDEGVQIALDYLVAIRPNVLLGGGDEWMTPSSAGTAGYVVVTNVAEMAALDPAAVTHVSGQFGVGQMPYEFDGIGELPHLQEMTSSALAVLEQAPTGFFLMVEGANIDHAAHDFDTPRMIQEALAFEAAVQVALDWATNRTDTLILVTADHETGGLFVTNDNGPGTVPDVEWTDSWHTQTPVGCWAWGTGSERVGGSQMNTDTFHALRDATLLQSFCLASVGTSTNLTMTWQSASGEVFRVDYTEGIDPPDWKPLGTVTADADSFILIDADVGPATNRIYRAVSLP